MRSIAKWLCALVALFCVSACGEPPATPPVSTVLLPTAEHVAPMPSPASPEPAASEAELRPVPARVADLHRTFFEPSKKPVPGGKIQCLITVHDGELSRDQFYAVALFGDGSIATWAESSKGRVSPFLAKLAPEENARAVAWLDELARDRSAARERFVTSTTVMGISTRSRERVETSYFATTETPEPLDSIAALLKDRLEATNAN